MAASDSRHYYEHPNHSAKERSQDSSDYYMSPVRGPVDMLGGAHNGRHVDGEHVRSSTGDSSTDSFYRAKLRDGFVGLRNSYHQKVNQRVPRPGPPPSQPPNYASQPTLQPRNRPPESTRPLSMHAAGYPAGSSYDGQRDHDYGTTSSRGSADSYHGVSSQQLPPLFRSSSDLHLDVSGNNYAFHDHPLRREFGSADLVEAKHAAGYGHSTDAEFFDMLRSYKADNADQRAPAPPGIHSVLRGESEATGITSQSTPVKPHSNHSQHAPTPGQQPYQPKQSHYGQPQTVPQHKQPYVTSNGPQAAGSPPSHQSLEFMKRSPKASRKGQRPRSGDVSALLRKLRPTKGEGEATGRADSNDGQITGVLSEILPEERLRKKAFVHHDCQSVGINFVEAAARRQSSQTGNTKTGASAAIQLDEQGEHNSNVSQKPTSLLVCNCSAFANELGSEEERNVALTHVTAQRRVSQLQAGGRNSVPSPSDIHRPAICNGLSILEGLPGSDNRQSLVEKHRGAYVLEYRDRGCTYYRQHFRLSEHQNYFGTDENVGPVAISIKREKVSPNSRLTDPASRYDNSQNNKHMDSNSSLYQYRVIVRTGELKVLRGVILEDALPTASRLSNSSRGLPAKDIIDYVVPEIQISSLKQATNDEKTKEQLLTLDELGKSDSYKVGIMYCKAGQSTEEEMYNNEHSSQAFTQFLDLIGRRVKLSGFENFKGGLDNRTDTTGTHSYYTTCQAHEIMFHVSTLLPFEKNRQQLLRKRHIGNDIVSVVFQEPGSLPFDVTSVRSQFQHVFIVVRVQDPNTERTTYSVAVTRSKDVPSFGPPITQSTYQHGAEFADFLIAKMLNAENASYLSDKFQTMAVRTRAEYLKDLASSYVTGNSLDSSSKLGKFSLSVGSGKKKEKKIGKVVPDVLSRGGLVWPTQLEDFGFSSHLDVYLIISADVIALMQMDTAEVVFSCWCSSVIGWTNTQTSDAGTGLRIYFNQGDCILVRPIDNEDTLEIIDRLRVVTLGCETREMILKRNDSGQLGFHVHMEGLVSDVDPQGYAYGAGLRTGSRLVEICKVAMVTLTHDQMIDLLRTSSPVSVSVIAPLESGKPRRSLEEKERSSDYYMLYPTEDRHRASAPIQPNVDGEESSAYFSDDETSPQSTVMSVAKRINTVTLRSSSSGGSSCSPGSTLSGKHQRRHVAHSRAKSQDQQHYSDTESISQRRPPTGPIYTPPQSQYATPSVPYYQSTHQGINSDHSSPPESLHRHRQRGEQQRRSGNSNGRAAKDWRHVEPPQHHSSQRPPYVDKTGPTDSRLTHAGSQEILVKPSAGNKHSEIYSATHGNYSNLDGLHFNRNLQRTLSDESLQSPSRRKSSPHALYTSNLRKVPGMAQAVGRPRTGSIPMSKDVDEDLDWSRLVSTASKAIESEPSSTSRSHDSSTDRDNSSLLSGNSTPTQDKTKDLEARCSHLDHELHLEKRRSKDLERRLQLERNKCEDFQKEIAQLKKENVSLRARLV